MKISIKYIYIYIYTIKIFCIYNKYIHLSKNVFAIIDQ